MNPQYVVDIREIVRRVTRTANKEFSAAVYETFLARIYTKNWGIPCISASLLEGPQDDFFNNGVEICAAATQDRLEPLDFLPKPEQLYGDDRSIWLFYKDGYMLMGDGHAIKQRWRNLHYRLEPDHK